jgi:hypothetical protein
MIPEFGFDTPLANASATAGENVPVGACGVPVCASRREFGIDGSALGPIMAYNMQTTANIPTATVANTWVASLVLASDTSVSSAFAFSDSADLPIVVAGSIRLASRGALCASLNIV